MKTKIDAVIVVEGTSDVSFLQSFIDAEFVTTNGSSVPRETIDYLQTLSLIKQIIVLTDPDFPGKQIRDLLDENIPNLKHAYIRKEYSIKKNKVGVAESTKDEVLAALKNLRVSSKIKNGSLTIIDLYSLNLIGGGSAMKNRKIVTDFFHIGFSNGKTLLKKLNSLGITYYQLEELLYGNK